MKTKTGQISDPENEARKKLKILARLRFKNLK